MPGMYTNSKARQVARAKAEQQVREKFPNLLEGSSGWCRAVNNRYSRLLGL